MNIVSETNLAQHYLKDVIIQFEQTEKLGRLSIEQLNDEEIHHEFSEGSNSVSIIVKHICGNMKSRWADFLTTDGEKPDRNREDEFVDDIDSKKQLLGIWEKGWKLLDVLKTLTENDLLKIITIRNEEHTVVMAINRQLKHYAYHVGQIVLLAKAIKGDQWKSLSIPKGKSNEYIDKPFKDESRKK